MGKGNNQNTFKFKISITDKAQSNMALDRGYVEYVGCPTVKDLVEWASHRSGEWGIITIGNMFSPAAEGEYRNGELIPSENHPEVPLEPFMDKRVQTVRYLGG
jgi:hypothetical protein